MILLVVEIYKNTLKQNRSVFLKSEMPPAVLPSGDHCHSSF
jgi:hypothetical protein